MEIKDCNSNTDGNFFNHPINNDIKTYEIIRKIATGDFYCLLDYPYFQKNYKMITIDLSKQQALDTNTRALDADTKAI